MTNLPAVLSGIAAVLVALGGLFAALRAHNNRQHQGKP